MKPVLFHRLARAEIVDAAHRYERKQPGLGARFVAVVMATADKIPRRAYLPPLMDERAHGAAFAELPRNWPYRLIVLEQPEQFLVLAVAHDKRQKGYWRRRVER